ncbi:MAG TPA: hypothetical protein VHD83_05245 [Puia sp.]|nr:hypothetical protein [Puia sp.]
MKGTALICCITLCFFTARAQQDTILPGSSSLNIKYLRPRSVFQKLTWLDKDGKLIGVATLNCVTKIDSANGKLIYLQLRNDGKRDSTIAEWPSLRPIYTSSIAGGKTLAEYDHKGQDLSQCFDDFLGDYLLGALPLKPGYHGQFFACGHDRVTVQIKEVRRDVLASGNGQPLAVNLVMVDYNGYDTMYWIDPSTGEILKFIFTGKDGSVFMKSKI